MQPIPTLHLRFVERDVIVSQDKNAATAKTIRVLQQFWEDPNGDQVVGDMFKQSLGRWRDVPVGRER